MSNKRQRLTLDCKPLTAPDSGCLVTDVMPRDYWFWPDNDLKYTRLKQHAQNGHEFNAEGCGKWLFNRPWLRPCTSRTVLSHQAMGRGWTLYVAEVRRVLLNLMARDLAGVVLSYVPQTEWQRWNADFTAQLTRRRQAYDLLKIADVAAELLPGGLKV